MDFEPPDTGFDLQGAFNSQLGQTAFAGHLIALQQRAALMEHQRLQLVALQEQIRIERDRMAMEASREAIERERLEIERRRSKAEARERELQRQQNEQIKQIRNLMADTLSELRMLQRRFP